MDKAKKLVARYQISLEDLQNFTQLQRSEEYIPIIVKCPLRAVTIEGLEANRMMQEIIMTQLKHRANLLAYKLKDLGVNPNNPFEQEDRSQEGFSIEIPEEEHWEYRDD